MTPSPTEAESSGTAVPEDPRGTSKAFTDKTIADVPAENTVSVDELYAILETGDAYVLDCRAISKHMRGMIEGSVCITAGSILEVRNREIPTDTDIYIIDQANDKVAEVFFTLDALGFDRAKLHAVDGGMQAWVDAGYPTVLGATAPC